MGQPVERRVQAEPVDRTDVAHQPADRTAERLHAPELHDLGPAAHLVGEGAEEFVDCDAVASFLQHLAPGGGEHVLAGGELALGQHPGAHLA